MKNKFLLFAIIAVSVIAAVFWSLKDGFSTSAKIVTVVRDTAIDAVPSVVNVRSDFAITLSSEESGRVDTSNMNLGSIVSKGDLILTIDSTDLQIDADILKADIANLEARLALNTAKQTELKKREEDLENNERLFASGNFPELEIIRQRRELTVFKEAQELEALQEEQELNDLNSQLLRIERRLEKTKIYSPTDGIITEIFAYPGELVNTGSALATIFSKAIIVEAKINEEDFAGVKPGQDATVRFLTYGNKLYKAKVSRVLPTADKETQQYTIFLDVAIPEERLLPGLSGEASIIRERKPDSLVIPRRALLGNFVFKVVDEKAVFTPVKVGVRSLNYVEITEGLKDGEIVVTDGMESLKDGDAVRGTN
ncbi:MAG: efflux RND transporter periplasmic adaptor subunit [Verrucomicrobiota bacterium]